MTKKQITQLVQASYTKNSLDKKTIERIATLLSRADLKQYIRALKLSEKAKTISLVLPDATLYNSAKKSFESLFTDKRIVVEEDPSLLLGIKVIDNDIVYDLSLKNSLDSFAKEVAES